MSKDATDKEIARELRRCRAAWRSPKGKRGKFAWCCHHEVEIEPLTEPAESRISCILSDKPKHEQARRLLNFRPVLSGLPKAYKAWKAYVDARKACVEAQKAYDDAWKARDFSLLHRKDVPNHTFGNGQSIF